MQVQNSRSPKVTVIGAGNVGATLAMRLTEKTSADLVLLDIVKGRAEGIALDLLQANAIAERGCRIMGTDSYDDTANSDVIVLSAGMPRREGMTRYDLLSVNAEIVKKSIPAAIAQSPKAILIVVTNPLDVMTYLAWQVSGLPANRVIGMAGILDAARFQAFIAAELNISPANICTMILGGHGDLMVPLPRYSTVNGIPITELMPNETIARLVQRTRDGGAEIVKLMKTGSAHYAPSAAIAIMIESILRDLQPIIPASAYLSGQYGLQDIFLGVPVKLGATGVERVIELELTEAEMTALKASALSVRENIDRLFGL